MINILSFPNLKGKAEEVEDWWKKVVNMYIFGIIAVLVGVVLYGLIRRDWKKTDLISQWRQTDIITNIDKIADMIQVFPTIGFLFIEKVFSIKIPDALERFLDKIADFFQSLKGMRELTKLASNLGTGIKKRF